METDSVHKYNDDKYLVRKASKKTVRKTDKVKKSPQKKTKKKTPWKRKKTAVAETSVDGSDSEASEAPSKRVKQVSDIGQTVPAQESGQGFWCEQVLADPADDQVSTVHESDVGAAHD